MPPLAQMLPALGWGERGMGKQLLLIRHGLKQRGQIGLHPRCSPTKTGEAFPLKGNHTSTGHETKGLSQWGARREAQAQQQPTSRCGREATQNDGHTQPTQLRTKQHLQPGLLTGLVETEPPARPGQIQAPPLPLEPAPPGHLFLLALP